MDTEYFLNQAVSLYRAWVSHILREARVLDELKKNGPLDTVGLSLELGFDKTALSTLCEAAYALGILGLRSDGRWSVSDKVYELLVSNSSELYVGGTLSYVCLRSLDLIHFVDLLKGKSYRSASLLKPFRFATEWDHTAFFGRFLKRNAAIKEILVKGARVLDIGCGNASWSTRLVKLFPHCEVVGVEPNREAFTEAREKVASAGLSQRVRILNVSIEEFNRKTEFDLCYMGEMLYSLKNKLEGLTLVHQSLKPKGILLIQEGLLPDDTRLLRRKEFVLGAAEQLDFLLQGAKFMRKSEVQRLVAEAGFGATRLTHLGGGVYVVQSRKPAERPTRASTVST